MSLRILAYHIVVVTIMHTQSFVLDQTSIPCDVVPPQPNDSRRKSYSGVHSWSHIYEEGHLVGIGRILSSSVEIDHISDICSASVDDPVVSVEGCGVAEP